MRRCWVLSLVALSVVATASSARALVAIMPAPGPTRAAQADAVFVGRVIALEDKDSEVMTSPTGGKITYRVALVTITDSLLGAKGVKTVRVGFVPSKAPVGGVIGIRPRPGFGPINLEVGQDGLFFLTKHFKEDLYLIQNNMDMLPRGDASFEKTLGEAKLAAKVLANPVESLKAGTPEDRFLAVSMLINKYRQPRFPSGKTEPISAEESKLILKAIRDGNWAGAVRPGMPNAYNLFVQLGLTAKDGWTPAGKTLPDIHKAAQDWLDKNADTYRVVRLIPGDGPGGAIGPRPGVVDPRPMPLPIKIKKIGVKPLPIERN